MNITIIFLFLLIVIILLCTTSYKIRGSGSINYTLAKRWEQYLTVPDSLGWFKKDPYDPLIRLEYHNAKKDVNDDLTDSFYSWLETSPRSYETILDLYKLSTFAIEYTNKQSDKFIIKAVAKGGFVLNTYLYFINKINLTNGTSLIDRTASDIDYNCTVIDKKSGRTIRDFTPNNQKIDKDSLYSELYRDWFYPFSCNIEKLYQNFIANGKRFFQEQVIGKSNKKTFYMLYCIYLELRSEDFMKKLIHITGIGRKKIEEIQKYKASEIKDKLSNIGGLQGPLRELRDKVVSRNLYFNINVKEYSKSTDRPRDHRDFVSQLSFTPRSTFETMYYERFIEGQITYLTPVALSTETVFQAFPLFRWGFDVISQLSFNREILFTRNLKINLIDLSLSDMEFENSSVYRHFNLKDGVELKKNILSASNILTSRQIPSVGSPDNCFKFADLSKYIETDLIRMLFCQYITICNASKVRKRIVRLIRDTFLSYIIKIDDNRNSVLTINTQDTSIVDIMRNYKTFIEESLVDYEGKNYVDDYNKYKSKLLQERFFHPYPLFYKICIGLKRTIIILSAVKNQKEFKFPQRDFYEFFDVCSTYSTSDLQSCTDIIINNNTVSEVVCIEEIKKIINVTLNSLQEFVKSKTINDLSSPKTNKIFPTLNTEKMIFENMDRYLSENFERRCPKLNHYDDGKNTFFAVK